MTNELVHPAEQEPGAGQSRPPLRDQPLTEEKREGWAGSTSGQGEDAGPNQPDGWGERDTNSR